MAEIIDLKNKHIKDLFEARDAINKLFDLGYHKYNDKLFVKMLNDVNDEIEKRAYR